MSVNGDRVRQAREIRGLTQAELAERIGVTQPTIAQIERAGSQQLFEPSSEIMEAIALQTSFPLAFFRQESGPELPLGSLLYRTRSSLLTSQDKRRLHQLTRLIYEIAEKMEQTPRLNTIPVRLPRVVNEDPVTAARVTRAHLGLSPDTPVKNLLLQIEKNGVLVFALPYTIDEHDAFSFWSDSQPRRPLIVISDGKPGDRQRFTLAHELGHLVMHYSFPQGLKEVEAEANEFASEFLMPEEAMRREITTPVTLTSLGELKPKWGVSIFALILRARDLGIITERQAVHLIQKRKKLWDGDEPPNLQLKAEKPRALKRMAEVIHGVPLNVEKIAAYNNSSVSLVAEVMSAHAEKPDMPRAEKKPDADRGKVVSIGSRR